MLHEKLNPAQQTRRSYAPAGLGFIFGLAKFDQPANGKKHSIMKDSYLAQSSKRHHFKSWLLMLLLPLLVIEAFLIPAQCAKTDLCALAASHNSAYGVGWTSNAALPRSGNMERRCNGRHQISVLCNDGNPDTTGQLPVTCDDGIQKGNETGVNCCGPNCEPCTSACPDILVEPIAYDGSSYEIRISNIGSVAISPDVQMVRQAYWNTSPAPTGEGAGGSIFFLSLEPGASQNYVFSVGTPALGTDHLVIIIDRDNDLVECDETNNVAYFTFDPVEIEGCRNPGAHNFNSAANLEDGSCLTCYDGIQNGDETGLDCGGSNCPDCSCSPLVTYAMDVFFTGNPTAPSYLHPSVSASNLGGNHAIYGFAFAGISGGCYSITNADDTQQNIDKYLEFHLSSDEGLMDLTTFRLDVRPTVREGVTPPTHWAVRSSVDNFSTNIISDVFPAVGEWNKLTIDLSSFQLTADFQLRFYAWGASGQTIGNLFFDNIQFCGGIVNLVDNNQCSGATPISLPQEGTLVNIGTFSNELTTSDGLMSSCNPTDDNASMWWSMLGDGGTHNFSLTPQIFTGTGYTLSLFQGNCNGLQQIACETDTPSASLSINLQQNTPYFLRVEGIGGTRGTFELAVESIALDCSASPHPDYLPLMALYNATDGPNWTNNTGWTDGAAGTNCDPCGWYGVYCNAGNRVTVLDLDGLNNGNSNAGGGNNLSGAIPEEITQLTFLEGFYLQANAITALPDNIGGLSNVVRLDLDSNNLSELPESIGDMASLQILQLFSNNLSTIPSSIGNLPSIQHIELNSNSLTTLPASIGSLSTLRSLLVSNNSLSSIPSEIGNADNLGYFSIDGNNLTSLPNEITDMARLWRLDVARNQLTSLPPGLGNMPTLLRLEAEENNLEGCFTPDLLNLCDYGQVTNTNNNTPGMQP